MRSLRVLMFTPIWPSAVASWSGLILLFFAMPTSTLFTSSSSGVRPSFRPCWICKRSSISMSEAFFFKAGDGCSWVVTARNRSRCSTSYTVIGSSLTSTTIDCSACACAAQGKPTSPVNTASSAPTAMQVHRVSFKYATTVEGHPRGGRGTDAGFSLLVVACASICVGTESAERLGLILIGAEIFQRQIHHDSLVRLDVLILNVALFVGDGHRQAVVLVLQSDAVADRLGVF